MTPKTTSKAIYKRFNIICVCEREGEISVSLTEGIGLFYYSTGNVHTCWTVSNAVLAESVSYLQKLLSANLFNGRTLQPFTALHCTVTMELALNQRTQNTTDILKGKRKLKLR